MKAGFFVKKKNLNIYIFSKKKIVCEIQIHKS